MKNTARKRKLISSLLLVMLLCSCAVPGMASGLFDGLLPAVSSEPAVDSYIMPDAVAEILKNFPLISRTNGKIRLTFTVPKGMLEGASNDGLVRMTYDFEALTLLMDYSRGKSESRSFPKEYAQKIFPDELRSKITKLVIVFENSTFLLEYPETVNAATAAAPAPAPVQKKSSYANDVCSMCYGLGMCNHCVNGDCNYCLGDGEEYCTGGCIGGRCIGCDDGKVLIGFDINNKPKYRNCSYCRYGACKTCGGDGYVNCNICYGTGNCNYCHGTGDCSYCY